MRVRRSEWPKRVKQVVKGIHLSKYCMCVCPSLLRLSWMLLCNFNSYPYFHLNEKIYSVYSYIFPKKETSERERHLLSIRKKIREMKWMCSRSMMQTYTHICVSHIHIRSAVAHFKFINSMSKMSGNWRRLILLIASEWEKSERVKASEQRKMWLER